jgi:transcriptional regulator GlxA family with amidase domain
MTRRTRSPIEVLIVAVPETAGSALYGMSDVLNAAGNIWQTLVRSDVPRKLFHVRIVSPTARAFRCGHGVPVQPDVSIGTDPRADIVILPELWLGPDETIKGRYPVLMDWLRRRHRAGAHLYSACSGAVMLAETGLLDRKPATSHWGYHDLFARDYPNVRFEPAPNLVFADASGRIVTAGGTTSWHDLVIHIISRHGSPGEALRIAQVYLLKWHGEGQLPYTPLVRRTLHADAVVRRCEAWLADNFGRRGAVHEAVAASGIPERSLKRRFKIATGVALIDYVQNLRVESAKRMLESNQLAVEEISARSGYEDASFFRRVFRRRTGMRPTEYRRMFQHIGRVE